jgi:sorbitol/mannitol transport system permease protein
MPNRPDIEPGWVGIDNYIRFITSSSFWPSVQTTLIIVGGVLLITVVFGVMLALLLDQPMWGQGAVRIFVIAPFFVMPTVSALVWKNIFMDPINGLLAHLWRFFGAEPVVWLSDVPIFSIIMIVSWQWLPFATLILLTAIQSLDSEQLEAAEMDGASPIARFFYMILPHMSRAITIVILIQTIFLLSIFAEIFVTTGGAFGTRTLSYLIFQRVLESQNVGLGSAGGVYAIILANIVAYFLMRIVGKNLDA